MFKKIFITIVVLFAIYFMLCFAGAKRWEASVTKTISGTPEQVFVQVGDFKNWHNWSSWMKKDDAMQITYGATTSGVGGSYSWDSKKQGKGSMNFTEFEPNLHTKSDLKFIDYDMVSDIMMDLKPVANGTEIVWSIKAQKETPFMQRGISSIMGLFYDVKDDFNAGLNNLDAYLKANPTPQMPVNAHDSIKTP